MTLFFSFLVLMVLKKRKLKFRLSEKRIKLEKIFLMILTNQLIYLVNVITMRKIFQIMCASQKVLTLMCTHDRFSFDLVHYYCKRKEHHLSQYLSMRKIHNVIRINDDWNPPFRFYVCSVERFIRTHCFSFTNLIYSDHVITTDCVSIDVKYS